MTSRLKKTKLTRYKMCIFLSNTMYHLYSKYIVRIIIIISILEGRHPHLDFSQLDLRRTEKHPNINIVPPPEMAQLPKIPGKLNLKQKVLQELLWLITYKHPEHRHYTINQI